MREPEVAGLKYSAELKLLTAPIVLGEGRGRRVMCCFWRKGFPIYLFELPIKLKWPRNLTVVKYKKLQRRWDCIWLVISLQSKMLIVFLIRASILLKYKKEGWVLKLTGSAMFSYKPGQ